MPTAAELTKSIRANLDRLEALTTEPERQAAVGAYLDHLALFHQYSLYNQLLIMMQSPKAERVAGYKTWQKLGRQVQAGEKGIAILAPWIPAKIENDDEEDKTGVPMRYFTVYVFDEAQTKGDPLPSIDWRDPIRSAQLDAAILAECAARGITVTERESHAAGSASVGAINRSPEAGTRTLLHEMAHHQLGHLTDSKLPRAVEEAEAEATAYAVATHFGIPGDGYSANYIAFWTKTDDGTMLQKSLARITAAAKCIIEKINPKD